VTDLLLRRASETYDDVIGADGSVIGRIFKTAIPIQEHHGRGAWRAGNARTTATSRLISGQRNGERLSSRPDARNVHDLADAEASVTPQQPEPARPSVQQ
jgi:hypothetical protein